MALKDAEYFIKDIVKDKEIRTSLYKYDSSKEIMEAIREMGYNFKLYDYEESINHLKTESPTENQAKMLDELKLWWDMLMSDGSIAEEMPASCSPAKCSTCSICG